MIKYKKNCKICQIVRVNKKLLQQVYDTSYYVPGSKLSLQALAREHEGQFTYAGLLNHCKKHQFIDSNAYSDAMLNQADQKAQQKAVTKAVKAVDAVQRVIDLGMERLENEEITVDTNQLIRASQVKIQQESKEKDQQLAMMEMMAHFISGEANPDNNRVFKDPVIDAIESISEPTSIQQA